MSDKALSPFQQKIIDVRGLLDRQKAQIAKALPKHLDPDRLLRISLSSITATPGLLDCTPGSLVACVMQSASLGLEPDPVLGEAYLIPYKTKCTLIPGYRGLIKLVRQSGQLSTIESRVVHALDQFDYALGLDAELKHRPSQEQDPGELLFVYAIARLKDGGQQFEVMSRMQVEKIRARSHARNNGPWITDYEEMARKTVLRRICKVLPTSTAVARAIALDEHRRALDPTIIDAVGISPDDVPTGMVEDEQTAPALSETGEGGREKIAPKAEAKADAPAEAAKPGEQAGLTLEPSGKRGK